MSDVFAAPLTPGEQKARITCGPITRELLREFAAASGDSHPLHVDPAVARSAGFADVFAHGMLVMGWVGRCLTLAVPQEAVRKWSARFVAITQLDDVVVCTAVVEELLDSGLARLALVAEAGGEVKLRGSALVELNSGSGRVEWAI